MRKNIEILDTYLKLGYRECPRRYYTDLLDKELCASLIFIRSTYYGDYIYYLQSGSSLFIPWEWINLFKGLWYYEGELIDRNTENTYFEKFIRYFTTLQSFPIDHCTKIDGIKYLEVLGDICNLGTKKFRELLKKEYDLVYDPLEYKSLTNKYTI